MIIKYKIYWDIFINYKFRLICSLISSTLHALCGVFTGCGVLISCHIYPSELWISNPPLISSMHQSNIFLCFHRVMHVRNVFKMYSKFYIRRKDWITKFLNFMNHKFQNICFFLFFFSNFKCICCILGSQKAGN